MGGCAAFGCKSRGANGIILKVFPKEPALRALWEVKVRRRGWKPTKTSRLCEKHFDEYQWEKTRVDGKRKLKFNAVPTIFSHTKPVKSRKPPTIRKPLEKPLKKCKITTRTELQDPTPVNETIPVIGPDDGIASTSKDSEANLPAKNDLIEKDKSIENLKLIIDRHRKDMAVMERKLIFLRRKLAEDRVQKHRDKDRRQRLEANLKRVFNDDQLTSLGRASMRFSKWSDTTISTALDLRLACGLKGYKRLLKLHLPFPSIRTLQKRIKKEKIEPHVWHEILEEQNKC